MKFFYNGKKLAHVPEEWNETMQSAQIAMLQSQGFRNGRPKENEQSREKYHRHNWS